MLQNNNLDQLINEPTHITPTTSSLIDLLITDSPGYVMQSGISAPLGDPYHCRINCVFKIKVPNHKKYKREIWNYSRANYGELNQCIQTAPWQIMDTFDNINDSCYAFTDVHEFNS